jgi:sigma-E factor negative regulatory protein RseB
VSLRLRTLVVVVGLVGGVVGAVGMLGLVAATASAARNPFGGVGDDDRRAVDLLRWAATATESTSYSGTRVVSAWGRGTATTVVVDVEHVAGQGTRVSVRGGAGEEAAFVASGDDSRSHDQLSLEAFDLLVDAYAVRLGGRDSVAGRPSRVVEVGRAGRVVAKLWVDESSGLLLRREMFDRLGRLSRESTFIDVDVTSSGFMAHLPPTAPETSAHAVGLGERLALEGAGWDCPHRAGTMRLIGIESLEGSRVLHMTYSDGLTRMSVFEQRGSLDAEAVDGYDRTEIRGHTVYVREGMPTYAVWEHDDVVFTAMTDGPTGTLAALVPGTGAGQASSSAEAGFWTRVAAGLFRLGDWASPLV